MKNLQHVTTRDNGACFLVLVDGLAISGFSTLAGAWNHIVWMHTVAGQKFTVGPNHTPVRQWMAAMYRAGWMYDNSWCKAAYEEMQTETDAMMCR